MADHLTTVAQNFIAARLHAGRDQRAETLRRYFLHVSAARRMLASARPGATGLALSALAIEADRADDLGLPCLGRRCRAAVDELSAILEGEAPGPFGLVQRLNDFDGGAA
jgi:hypothetical protein